MWQPEFVVATARAVRARLRDLLPASEADEADAELGLLLARAEAGADVTNQLLDALRRREATRQAVFDQLRGERSGRYQPLLGVGFAPGARYVCPVGGCQEVSDRLDDSEPEPRCAAHGVTMHRL